MRTLILEFAAAIALTFAAILTLATGVSASDVIVKAAFARASATPTSTSGAIYLTISAPETDRLTAIATPVASMAHLHRTVAAGDVMKMELVDALDIAGGAETVLAPGGTHIMLMGLTAPLRQGQSFPLELVFEKAGKIVVQVPVGGVAASSP